MSNGPRHGGESLLGGSALEWWRGAVIYQVYPRSFADSNGDGIGDLRGITEHLDYIADLGVSGIWIAPFFTSPMKDFGYDVADYRGVDPIFGTLADFDGLVERAHELGLKVIIDQVWSHTSDQHAWFEASRSDPTGPRADWYVWARPKPDGSPPNNWLSVFGGPAWTWDARRRRYYLHNFLSSQPDLNLHNAAVREALLDAARFWLERGVDGFRLDALNFGMHDLELRDNPPAHGVSGEPARPYEMQVPRYTLDHPAMPAFLERVRSVMDEYGEIMTVAEVGGGRPMATQLAYTSGRRLSTAYALSFLGAERPDARGFREILSEWPSDRDAGWPAWAFSNHDAPRVASRWADVDDPRTDWARLLALLLVSLRGNLFVYQGEELGLPQAAVPYERLRDPEAIANWPATLGRDGARTPMPWQAVAPQAGFSTAEPWLPVDPRHPPLAVDAQAGDPSSTLAFFRRVLRLRRESLALRVGRQAFVDAPDGVLAFTREAGDERCWCVFNLGPSSVRWCPPGWAGAPVAAAVGCAEDDRIPEELDGHAGYIAQEPPGPPVA